MQKKFPIQLVILAIILIIAAIFYRRENYDMPMARGGKVDTVIDTILGTTNPDDESHKLAKELRDTIAGIPSNATQDNLKTYKFQRILGALAVRQPQSTMNELTTALHSIFPSVIILGSPSTLASQSILAAPQPIIAPPPVVAQPAPPPPVVVQPAPPPPPPVVQPAPPVPVVGQKLPNRFTCNMAGINGNFTCSFN